MRRVLSWLLVLLPLATPFLRTAPPALPQDQEAFRGGAYTVDAGHSSVFFGIRHFGVSNFYGRFNDFSGSFTVDMEEPSNCSVTISIDPNSVDTNSQGRDNHIKSPDFLDVEAHDAMTFQSTSVEKLSDDTLKVTGDMTMHGVTNEITTEVALVGSGDTAFGPRAGVEARFLIKRTEFGMDAMLDKLGDEIRIIISLEGMLGGGRGPGAGGRGARGGNGDDNR